MPLTALGEPVVLPAWLVQAASPNIETAATAATSDLLADMRALLRRAGPYRSCSGRPCVSAQRWRRPIPGTRCPRSGHPPQGVHGLLPRVRSRPHDAVRPDDHRPMECGSYSIAADSSSATASATHRPESGRLASTRVATRPGDDRRRAPAVDPRTPACRRARTRRPCSPAVPVESNGVASTSAAAPSALCPRPKAPRRRGCRAGPA